MPCSTSSVEIQDNSSCFDHCGFPRLSRLSNSARAKGLLRSVVIRPAQDEQACSAAIYLVTFIHLVRRLSAACSSRDKELVN